MGVGGKDVIGSLVVGPPLTVGSGSVVLLLVGEIGIGGYGELMGVGGKDVIGSLVVGPPLTVGGTGSVVLLLVGEIGMGPGSVGAVTVG